MINRQDEEKGLESTNQAQPTREDVEVEKTAERSPGELEKAEISPRFQQTPYIIATSNPTFDGRSNPEYLDNEQTMFGLT